MRQRRPINLVAVEVAGPSADAVNGEVAAGDAAVAEAVTRKMIMVNVAKEMTNVSVAKFEKRRNSSI